MEINHIIEPERQGLWIAAGFIVALFALGLTANAIGQVLWDIQVAAGWNPFPGPSDAFYLLLGPLCGIGLVRVLRARTTVAAQRTAALDVGALGL